MRLKKAAKDIIICIIGPTAIGKTRISIRLAKRIHGEIISSDSMQIYRGMNILSQAPTQAEQKRAKHHLINILSPEKEYSVASFRRRAVIIIRAAIKRGKVPIIVGGSGLYLKALIYGLFPAPPADMEFRARMQRFTARHGSKKLHERLVKIDPASARAIHQNDTRRIIRSLEIAHTTGRTMTELKGRTKGLKDRYNVKIFCLTAPRKKIYARIDKRVDAMFSDGAVNEVKRLAAKSLSKTAGAVLGLKEINGYLKGEYDIAGAQEMMKMNTRRFAKRQLAWFRADPSLTWIDITRNSDTKILKRIMKEVR
jgi:tRNA dimethylallyltransferase